ncbi:helix-turn-helix transcriptional regulator [Kitasatospora camelliae]|uniref:Helix-turn-helix transcriptional regulator n=1 Tax=Kitasatospora camelliae TaxID=3156397 RepID=A0AAU8JR01_9ACTN
MTIPPSIHPTGGPVPSSDPQPTESARARFGARLRHWRRLRGLSQAELGRRLGYDDSHISRVETAHRWPPPGLAARADELLGTGGELTGIWPELEHDREQWKAVRSGGTEPAASAEAFEQLLHAYRDATATVGGRPLAAVLAHHTGVLARTLRTADGRSPLLVLGARYAELAGWACYDEADHHRALAWYDLGLEWARSAGDPGTAAVLLARRSGVHRDDGHLAAALATAEAAHRTASPDRPAVRAAACLALARGHALAGDRNGARRALDEAAALARRAGPDPAVPWAGRPDESATELAIALGTCHRDLAARTGRHSHARLAVAALRRALAGLPAAHAHIRALVTVRLAGAYLWADRPDLARPLLATTPPTTGRLAHEHTRTTTWLTHHTPRYPHAHEQLRTADG